MLARLLYTSERILFPITRNTAIVIKTVQKIATCANNHESAVNFSIQSLSKRTSCTPLILFKLVRNSARFSDALKSLDGFTITTAGNGLSSKISNSSPKPDQLLNSFKLSWRET